MNPYKKLFETEDMRIDYTLTKDELLIAIDDYVRRQINRDTVDSVVFYKFLDEDAERNLSQISIVLREQNYFDKDVY